MHNRRIEKYLVWLPAFLIASIIFYLSSQPGEDSTVTSESVGQLLLTFGENLHMINVHNLSFADIYKIMEVPLRKGAHMIEYAALNLSILFALRKWDLSVKKSLGIAFLLAIFYACTDEVHQLFVSGRAGLVSDVIVDIIGVAISLLLSMLYYTTHLMTSKVS